MNELPGAMPLVITALSIMTLNITILGHNAECRVLIIIMLNVIMLNVIMLNVIMLNVVAPTGDHT